MSNRLVELAQVRDKDHIFDDPARRTQDFEFSPETAAVFDDMVSRSVPFYDELQRMTVEIAADFALPGSNLVDLGCATGTTMIALDAIVPPDVHFIGIDNSQAMLDVAERKLSAADMQHGYSLRLADLHQDECVENASVVIMILTLQFLRPIYRETIMRRICQGMRRNSALILIEKLTVNESGLNRQFINYYYNEKRRSGYSELEISKKREALENVLIPYREDENRSLLQMSGFRHAEAFFRWYNFGAFVAVK